MPNPKSLKKVILDKSFLQAENKDCSRLRCLHDAGAIFILTDTLIYELCTDARGEQWSVAQRKLFAFADSIEIWRHVGVLLKSEVENQKPVASPVDCETTSLVREWFRKGKEYVPSDLKTISASVFQEREVTNVAALKTDCLNLCGIDPKYTARANKNGRFERSMIAELVRRDDFLNYVIRRDHGNPADKELYITGAERVLNSRWFAYHSARTTLALYGLFMLKYGLVNTPGEDFTHSKLDSEYIALLHYADALATNETKSMADMCGWLYQDSKMIFSTSNLDAVLPKSNEIQIEAYWQWERGGRTHGHDSADWFCAKKLLTAKIWEHLISFKTKAA